MDPRTHSFEWKSPTPDLAGRSGLAFLEGMARGEIPQAPFHSALGMRLLEATHGHVKVGATPAPYHCNLLGTIHGGFTSTLLDSALGCAVLSTLDADTTFATLELHVHMVRALTLQTGPVVTEARVVHRGRQVATSEGRILDASGKLYAHATCTCLLSPRRGA